MIFPQKLSLLVVSFFLLTTTPSSLVLFVMANDECSNAVTITKPLPFTITGDTTDATVDFPNPTDNFRNLTCGISVEGKGIWYKYEGDDAFVKATVSATPETTPASIWNIKTALFRIYNNNDNSNSDCHVDDLNCMTSSQYGKFFDRTSNPTSEWYAHSGITYLLHVSGVNDDDVGEFELNVESLNYEEETNDYDRCDRAFQIPVLGDFFTLNGNTVATRPNDETTLKFDDLSDTCSIRDSSRGNYVTFVGNGKDVTITIQDVQLNTHFEDVTEGRFEVAVLSGEDCDQCILFRDFIFAATSATNDNGDEAQSEIHDLLLEKTDKDTKYTVLVAGESYSDVGTFNLIIQSSACWTVAGATKSLLWVAGFGTVAATLLF